MLALTKEKVKAKVYGIDGKPLKEIELPEIFNYEINELLIRRAFLSILTAKLQPKGAYKYAGREYTAEYVGLRLMPFMERTINVDRARLPRLKNRRHLLQGNVALVPQAVKGPKAHPPKPEKVLHERINKKEKKLATLSALSACKDKNLVAERHVLPENITLPVIVSNEFENIEKTKQVVEFLKALDLYKDVENAKEKKRRRAGKGKLRARPYKRKKSILFVFSKKCNAMKAVRNLEGVDVCLAKDINAYVLAPGGKAGRLLVISEEALNELANKKWF